MAGRRIEGRRGEEGRNGGRKGRGEEEKEENKEKEVKEDENNKPGERGPHLCTHVVRQVAGFAYVCLVAAMVAAMVVIPTKGKVTQTNRTYSGSAYLLLRV